MVQNSSPVWVITGASRGFGAEFVSVALEHGARVAATARKPEAVTDAFGIHDSLLPVALDVCDPDSITNAINTIIDTWGRIDVLINNAGYGIFGALEECSDTETRAIYDTNVLAL